MGIRAQIGCALVCLVVRLLRSKGHNAEEPDRRHEQWLNAQALQITTNLITHGIFFVPKEDASASFGGKTRHTFRIVKEVIVYGEDALPTKSVGDEDHEAGE